MPADCKVAVLRHRIHARCVVGAGTADARQVTGKHLFHPLLLGGIERGIKRERIGNGLAAGVLGNFYSAIIQLGKAIKKTFGSIECKTGKAARRIGGTRRLGSRSCRIPKERLTQHREL